MDWRVYLTGDQYEMDFLVKQFTEEPLKVERDDGGVYLTGSRFAAANDADAALELGRANLPQVNGLSRMLSCAFRRVALANRVSSPSARTINVYVSDTGRAIDEVSLTIFGAAEVTGVATIEADGEVRDADGTFTNQRQHSDLAALWAASDSDPVMARALSLAFNLRVVP